MLTQAQRERGDTLIEVLFAITVFSLIVVSSLAIMNQGAAAAQRSLEISLVSQQIDNQAEALRFLHESYVTNYYSGYATDPNLTIQGPTGQFYEIVKLANLKRSDGVTQASAFGASATCPTPPGRSFIINTNTATINSVPTVFQPAEKYSELIYDAANPASLTAARGIWIEPIKAGATTNPTTSSTGYIDFHIRACWQAPGVSVPVTLGTIVRLYEPRS